MSYYCPHCGSEGRIQVQAVISAPAALAHQFSKQNLRRADVHLMGVLWETMDFICGNEKCGRVTDGYGNYVTNLAKRVKELEKLVADIPQIHSNDCTLTPHHDKCSCHVARMEAALKESKP